MSESGFQGSTDEWRWPVVDANEPKDVRAPHGYVTILRHSSKETGSSARFSIHLADSEGRPIQGLNVEDFWMFHDAVSAALKEMGLQDQADAREIVGDIIR